MIKFFKKVFSAFYKVLCCLWFLFSISLASQEAYIDNFNLVSYANNNGSLNWTAPWIEDGETTNPSAGNIQISGGQLTFQQIGATSIRREANLAGANIVILDFDWQANGLTSTKGLSVQISVDGGSTYTTLGEVNGTGNGNFNQDISGYATQNTVIRFIRNSGSTWSASDYAYIDNLTMDVTLLDNDEDGVYDHVDLDDDNDGILDSDECGTLTNIAVGKTATQSSIYYSAVATKAIDGDTNGVYSGESVSHTTNEANPWWQVDLGAPYTINKIKVWNRTDCCNDRLDDFIVEVLDASSTILYTYTHSGAAGVTTSILLPTPLTANKVKVRLVGSGRYLSLAEVELFWVCDTDSDGTPDYLDLDADNDGCPDALEGGAGFDYTDLDPDASLGGTVNTDGIPTIAGTGQTKGSSIDETTQAAECDPCNTASPFFSDTDGDGIGNACDLDNDNDGILDTDECDFTRVYNPAWVVVNSNEVKTTFPSGATVTATLTADPSSITSYGTGTLSTNSYWSGSPYSGIEALNSLLANVSSPRTLSLEFRDVNGNLFIPQGLQIAWDYVGGGYPYDPTTLKFTLQDGVFWKPISPFYGNDVMYSMTSVQGDNPTLYGAGVFDVVNPSSIINFDISNVGPGNYPDGMRMALSFTDIDCDFDGDGLPNYLDTDSDNDGCPDALEGGAGFDYTDLDPDTSLGDTVNTDGIPTITGTGQTKGSSLDETTQAAECNPCNATSSLYVDTDTDGVGDVCDLDDDNDGILDKDEMSCSSSYLVNYGVEHGANTSLENLSTNATISNLTVTQTVIGNNDFLVSESQYARSRVSNNLNNPAVNTFTFSAPVHDYEISVRDLDKNSATAYEAVKIDAYFEGELVLPTTKVFGVNTEEAVAIGEGFYTGTNKTGAFTNMDKAMNYAYDGKWVDQVVVTHTATNTIKWNIPIYHMRGCIDLDSDNDGIINSLDLDSDNDGCPDALEGGAGFDYSDLDPDTSLGVTVNTDGIPTIAGTGQTKGSSIDEITQAAECNACNATSSLYVDTDTDGVGDVCDLDDDNDGILDSEECSESIAELDWSTTTWTGGSLINTYTIAENNIKISVADPSNSLLTTPPFVTPGSGAYYQGDQASVDESLIFAVDYGDFGTSNTITITLELGFLGFGLDDFTFDLFDVDGELGALLRQEEYTINGSLLGVSATPIITKKSGATQTVTGNLVTGYDPTPSTGSGSDMGVINVSFATAVDKVSIVFKIADGSVHSPSSTSTPGFSLYNLRFKSCATDTDGDGTMNSLDLDSDDDGCLDVVEAGFTDDNNDGLLGPNPVSVDTDGLVTTGSNGYTTPNDLNGNTTLDFLEYGEAPTVSSHPQDLTLCPGCTGTMTATSNGDTFQWQVLDGSTWNDLVDNGLYSGTLTNTLTITNASPNEQNNQYRLEVTNTGYVCGETFTNQANLFIKVTTVITNRQITYRVRKN